MGLVKRNAGRWPNGVIPLQRRNIFLTGGPEAHPNAINSLNDAIIEYADNTAIDIVPWAGQPDFVIIENDIFGGVSSRKWGFSGVVPWWAFFLPIWGAFGREGGEQFLWMAIGTPTPGAAATSFMTFQILHEFSHVIGLFHEHQRPDRLGHVTLDFTLDGINHGILHRAHMIGIYDCLSVTNYFTAPINLTGCATTVAGGTTGGRTGTLSEGDIQAINFLYPVKRTRAVSNRNSGWNPGWIGELFQLSGNPHAFWYHPADGTLSISELSAITNRQTTRIWRREKVWAGKKIKNMLSLRGGLFGGSIPLVETAIILFYYPKSGTAESVSIRPQTTGVSINRPYRGKIGPGWTHFSSFIRNFQQHFLAYNKVTGKAAFFKMSGDGKSIVDIWNTGNNPWGAGVQRGWTHFEFFTVGNALLLLAYNSDTGALSYSIIRDSVTSNLDAFPGNNPFGRFATQAPISGVPGWTTFRTYVHNGQNYLFLYNHGSGDLQVWNIELFLQWRLIGETRRQGEFRLPWFNPRFTGLSNTFIPYTAQDPLAPAGTPNRLWFLAYAPGPGLRIAAEFGRIYAV